MTKKHKKVYRTLNYNDHLLVFVSAVSQWLCFDFCFCFIIRCFCGIASSAVGMKMREITAGSKKA